MSSKLNEFQTVVLQACEGHYAVAAPTPGSGKNKGRSGTDLNRVFSSLKKNPDARFLVALVEALGQAENIGDAASRLINVEIELKRAFSAIGGLSMAYAARSDAHDPVRLVEPSEAPLQPETTSAAIDRLSI